MSKFKLPECYIYLYHTDEYFILPQYPASVNDRMDSNFTSQNALSRTAPIFSYNNSGPRSIDCVLDLHRDMMNDANLNNARVKIANSDNLISINNTDDYIDILIKKLQSIALPKYLTDEKLVNPPMVAVRFGEEIFIKGVVASGGVSVQYQLPLLSNNKYARVNITFSISETQPYDAESVGDLGSFRGLTAGLKNKLSDLDAYYQ